MKEFKFQSDVCNGCRDVLLMSMNLNVIVILSNCGVECHCTNNRISKSETVNLL